MKQVNYAIWARIIQGGLFLNICIIFLGFGFSIVKNVFNLQTDFNIKRLNYGYIDYKKGFPVKARLYLEIPDTVISYQNGTINKNYKNSYRWDDGDSLAVKDTVINQFKPRGVDNLTSAQLKEVGTDQMDRVSNHIQTADKVVIRVKTENIFRRWFYILYDQLDHFFIALICFWIIKLIDCYLKGNFLKPESFHIISRIGHAFIWMNVISFIFMEFNLHILPDFDLNSTANASGNLVNHVNISLEPINEFNPTNILIGVSVLILSDIIKNAIIIKREQDLTI
ncbi:MAG: DUF2975 domain-containing protein [Bacteroidota bacterium]